MLKNLSLLACSLLAALLLCEAGIRIYLYLAQINRPTDIVVGTYVKTPFRKGERIEFDAAHNLEFKAAVQYNNQGYRSAYDWSEDKAPDEFRIAVFGDSFTECETSDYPWPDVLHEKLSSNRELAAALGGRRISVANFGRSGAGFHAFALEYLRVRDRYKPDLTVFAFIDEDFEQLISRFRPELEKHESNPKAYQSARLQNRYTIEIPGFDGRLFAAWTGNRVGRQLYYTGSDLGPIMDKERMTRAKRFLAGFAGERNILLARHSKLLEFTTAQFRQLAAKFAPPPAPDEYAPNEAYIAGFHEAVALVGPEPLLLAAIPAFYEEVNQFAPNGPVRTYRYWPFAAKRFPELRFICLRDFLPRDADYKERYSWYTLPWDGHPSNAGATVYGEAMAGVLSRLLRGDDGVLASPSLVEQEIRRSQSYQALQSREPALLNLLTKARNLKGKKDYAASLELYTKVLDANPDIGAPGVVYMERAMLLQTMNRPREALEDFTRALAKSPEKQFRLGRLALAKALRLEALVQEDLAALRECCRDDPSVAAAIKAAAE